MFPLFFIGCFLLMRVAFLARGAGAITTIDGSWGHGPARADGNGQRGGGGGEQDFAPRASTAPTRRQVAASGEQHAARRSGQKGRWRRLPPPLGLVQAGDGRGRRSRVKTILVVEDEMKIARLVRDYLERAGFDVVVAGDGEAALASARGDRPTSWCSTSGLPGLRRAGRHARAPPDVDRRRS